MAWRCSGRTNQELLSNMFQAGIITSERVTKARPPIILCRS